MHKHKTLLYGPQDKLLHAIYSNDFNLFLDSIGEGADLNSRIGMRAYLPDRNNCTHTPVMFATHMNRVDMAKRMIDLGCDVNYTDKFNTPLSVAMSALHANPDISLINALLDKGANPNHKDINGCYNFMLPVIYTPIFMPKDDFIHLMDNLIQHGADLTLRYKNYGTLTDILDAKLNRPLLSKSEYLLTELKEHLIKKQTINNEDLVNNTENYEQATLSM